METTSIRPIKTEDQYKAAMAQMQLLWNCPENSPEADLLEVLSILVEQYEKKEYAIEPLDPIDAIKYEMEERGLSQRDMVNYFGSKERVSEVLNRKRPLTLKMIKTLYHELGIPASILLA
jgi:HTH-type transcriptional regulator / antitoxin HigA